jgi:glucose/arabinose dehydrogenase
LLFAGVARVSAQLCGDADGNGVVTTSDGVQTLRAAAELSSICTLARCDVDGDGRTTLADAVNVLRAAALLSIDGTCTPLPALKLTPVAHGLDQPLFLTAPADDLARLFVVEQSGRIQIVRDGGVLTTPFLDLSGAISCCGERGLLGMAFHPSYGANGRFFVDYTDRDGNITVAEYARSAANPEVANPAEVRTFFTAIHQPFANHNGGSLAFGSDGFLYVGVGDGGGSGDSQGNAQNPGTKLGKILRLDVDTHPTPPPGNVTGGDPDVWDFGLRNPFRFGFDRATGNLYIGDVGQGRFEEIDVELAGDGRRNYGWNVTEGLACFNPATGCDTTGLTLPVTTYDHDGGDCSVIGGYVYRGAAIPGLNGRYLYGDFCSSRIRSLVFSGGRATSEVELSGDLESTSVLGNISSFGEDARGELYVIDLGGDVFRIDPE